ncbi:MAG: N-acetylmuramoyl-L-alanine amidase [Pseudomonadota bacterium]
MRPFQELGGTTDTKHGFTRMTVDEFETWIAQQTVARTIVRVQQHHTYSPDYLLFETRDHFQLQKGMKNYHVGTNGWSDIGQHFSTFPDGMIVTGRGLNTTPACIYGANSKSICIEHVGNFDDGGDVMTEAHAETTIRMTAALLRRFGLGQPDKMNIVYHH